MVLAALETFLRDWPYLTILVLLGVTGVVAAPSLLAATVGVRRLSPTEAAALADWDVPTECVRVVSRPAGVPTAFALGVLPGHRTVCVTDRLVDVLTPAELGGVVVHELGHLRRYHALFRLGVPTTFVVAWAAAVSAGLDGAFLGGLLLVLPVALASFALSRWSEHDADAYVARHGYGAALADALDRLGRLGYLRPDEAGTRRLFSRHPSLRERVGRLRETRRTAENGRVVRRLRLR